MPHQRSHFSPGEQFDGTEEHEEVSTRGKITDFSAKSARRFRDFLMSFRRDACSHFITLTYPAEFPAPDDHEVYKGHLDAISKRIARRWPQLSSVWRLEFQQRGAAHYHLLAFGLPAESLTEFQFWISRAWFEVVGSGDARHFRAGTNVKKVEGDFRKTAFYLSSYVSKKEQVMPGNFTGRYWGKLNGSALPVSPLVVDALSRNQAIAANRIVRKVLEKQINARRVRTALDQSVWGSCWSINQVDFIAPGKRSLAHDPGGPCIIRLEDIPEDIRPRGRKPIEGVKLPSIFFHDFHRLPFGFKRPRKFKARGGQSCSLYGDASGFREQVLRAVAGIVDAPRPKKTAVRRLPLPEPSPLPQSGLVTSLERARRVAPTVRLAPVAVALPGFETPRRAVKRSAMSFRIND
jgi:hypothetical protein